MSSLLFYLLQVIAASGLLYGYYHFALRNKRFHRYNRFYLLMAVVISSFIPFLNIPVYFSENENGSSVVLQTLQVISSPAIEEIISPAMQTEPVTSTWFNAESLAYLSYVFIILFFLLRVFISLNKIRFIIKKNPSEQIDKIKFINTDEPGTPFSFFSWLFWNRKIELHSEKGEQIFRHELFHIQQRHSRDIIFVELLTVIFWINPFFHLIKRELNAIHEFLADEFAIKENNNWQYAELLLMQVLNTNNNLINSFFHNQIKRRVAMITTSTKPSYQYLRKLMVFPVVTIIIFLFAFSYKTSQKDYQGLEKVGLEPLISKSNADTTRPLNDRFKMYDNYLVVIDSVIQSQRGLKNIESIPILKNGFGMKVLKDKDATEKYGDDGKNGVVEIRVFSKDAMSRNRTVDLPVYAYLTNPEEFATIKLDDIKEVKQLKIQKASSVPDCELISFKITIDNGLGSVKEFFIKGNAFSDELLKAIDVLDSQTFIIIEDIDIKVNNRIKRLRGKIYSVNSITTAPD